MSAIILDGQLKSALAAVRSLGRSGVIISVGAVRDTRMALHSRHASARFVYPSPYTDQEGFIREIKKEAERLGDKPVVYAFSDATYLSLYAHRSDLCECMTLIFPDEKSVEIAYDKAATYSLARVSGVPTMSTYAPESFDEIVRLSETLSYPAVLKTRRSVTWKDGVGIFGSASFVQDKEELKNNFQELKEKLGEAPLVQDFLLGEEYGVEMLAQNGEVYARVSHHRMRSLSPTGGASVLKETLRESDLKNTMETYAAKLVKVLAWSGPIMVEFKVDSDTREPRLMEINGRFWGSLPLSVSAGVDMPYLYYIQATKGTVPSSIAVAYEGVITNHFLGDIMHLVRVLVKIDPMRKYLYPTRMHAIRDFCILPVGTKADVFSFQDPKPALFEVIDALKKICK